MTDFFGTGVFWASLLSITVILSITTLIGRTWCVFLPLRLGAPARFYLSPVLGIATLTIIASIIGRILPIGNTVTVSCIIVALLVIWILGEKKKQNAFRHAIMVSAFGLICGITFMGPLWLYGAFNPHNDAFTYLVHSTWLQEHAFGEFIPQEMVTPFNSQISLYQNGGYRMGASFFLSLMQAVLNVKWAFDIYPAVIIAYLTVCCLAIGFPLTQALAPIQRWKRLLVLALPAFSLGGLAFGSNFGFLPQTAGLAMGAGLLFMVGPQLRFVASSKAYWKTVGKAALPSVPLLVGATFAYSEIAPFLVLALVGSAFALAFRYNDWSRISIHCGVLLGLTMIVLNSELYRVYAALSAQSGAVVASPVDWSILGYVAHAFGIHGGAWTGFQWSTSENVGTMEFALGLILLGVVVSFFVAKVRVVWCTTLNGIFMPPVIAISIFSLGIIYFRYFVSSPFSSGVGQSWSQFKLSEWAHPFVMALSLFAIVNYRQKLGNIFNYFILFLFVIGIVGATVVSVAQIHSIMQYYPGVGELDRFYLKFRDTVNISCPDKVPVYLSLQGDDLKFRQMAVLYLYDRNVLSDWNDDGYIVQHLPSYRKAPSLAEGSCVVEPISQDGLVTNGVTIGPFRVGVVDRGKIRAGF